MKKSLLSLAITSLLLLSACDEKIDAGKLLEAEKTITELNTRLKNQETELGKLQTELNRYQTLKNDEDALKAKSGEKSFPALQVEIVELFNQSEELTFEKDPENEFAPENSRVALFATTAKSGIAWLDQLILTEIFGDEEKPAPQAMTQASVQTQLRETYQSLIGQAKEEKPLGLTVSVETTYLGQRNHIAAFSVFRHYYSGGAHGMFNIDYLNIDTQKQKLIRLDDLVSPEKQDELKAALWESHRLSRTNEEGKFEGFATEQDFYISESFYFTPDGIIFAYPPYELGPFAEGIIEVMLSWDTANTLIQPDYRRTAKDGFQINPIEF